MEEEALKFRRQGPTRDGEAPVGCPEFREEIEIGLRCDQDGGGGQDEQEQKE